MVNSSKSLLCRRVAIVGISTFSIGLFFIPMAIIETFKCSNTFINEFQSPAQLGTAYFYTFNILTADDDIAKLYIVDKSVPGSRAEFVAVVDGSYRPPNPGPRLAQAHWSRDGSVFVVSTRHYQSMGSDINQSKLVIEPYIAYDFVEHSKVLRPKIKQLLAARSGVGEMVYQWTTGPEPRRAHWSEVGLFSR